MRVRRDFDLGAFMGGRPVGFSAPPRPAAGFSPTPPASAASAAFEVKRLRMALGAYQQENARLKQQLGRAIGLISNLTKKRGAAPARKRGNPLQPPHRPAPPPRVVPERDEEVVSGQFTVIDGGLGDQQDVQPFNPFVEAEDSLF